MYVRALYDCRSYYPTALSFQKGDMIQVISQLESGWWDGDINGVRGWFPSNYCQTTTILEDVSEERDNGARGDVKEGEMDEEEVYDE